MKQTFEHMDFYTSDDYSYVLQSFTNGWPWDLEIIDGVPSISCPEALQPSARNEVLRRARLMVSRNSFECYDNIPRSRHCPHCGLATRSAGAFPCPPCWVARYLVRDKVKPVKRVEVVEAEPWLADMPLFQWSTNNESE